jgi:hypothetical protein
MAVRVDMMSPPEKSPGGRPAWNSWVAKLTSGAAGPTAPWDPAPPHGTDRAVAEGSTLALSTLVLWLTTLGDAREFESEAPPTRRGMSPLATRSATLAVDPAALHKCNAPPDKQRGMKTTKLHTGSTSWMMFNGTINLRTNFEVVHTLAPQAAFPFARMTVRCQGHGTGSPRATDL